jgi:hypothetical protein
VCAESKEARTVEVFTGFLQGVRAKGFLFSRETDKLWECSGGAKPSNPLKDCTGGFVSRNPQEGRRDGQDLRKRVYEILSAIRSIRSGKEVTATLGV